MWETMNMHCDIGDTVVGMDLGLGRTAKCTIQQSCVHRCATDKGKWLLHVSRVSPLQSIDPFHPTTNKFPSCQIQPSKESTHLAGAKAEAEATRAAMIRDCFMMMFVLLVCMTKSGVFLQPWRWRWSWESSRTSPLTIQKCRRKLRCDAYKLEVPVLRASDLKSTKFSPPSSILQRTNASETCALERASLQTTYRMKKHKANAYHREISSVSQFEILLQTP